MADALQIFKEALIAKKAADEAAARDAEAKIERGRRVDAITRKFEAMIGEVVGTVSSASTELEASASTLTNTAQRGQELATVSQPPPRKPRPTSRRLRPLGGAVVLHHRDQPPRAGIGADGGGGRRAGARTNDRVNALSQAASRIGDVVELINTIAARPICWR